MGRKSASGSRIRDEQPGSYFLELRNHFFGVCVFGLLKFFDADPGSGMDTVRIRDGKKSKHPGSATLATKDCHSGMKAVLQTRIGSLN